MEMGRTLKRSTRTRLTATNSVGCSAALSRMPMPTNVRFVSPRSLANTAGEGPMPSLLFVSLVSLCSRHRSSYYCLDYCQYRMMIIVSIA